MAPKTTSRSRQHSKDSEVKEVREQSPPQEIEEDEEEDPEEEEEELQEDDDEDDDLQKSTENSNRLPKSGSVHLNGFVSDSGSESDSDDSNSGYKVQPIPKPAVTGNTSISSPAKRTHLGTSDGQRSKRPKPSPNGKKPSSGSATLRVWNLEDEIIVLREMADFKRSKGVDLNLELVAFYDSIKGKLRGDYSKDQLRTKLKHMRRKYLNNMMIFEKGSDPTFSNSHEALVFDLSKKAWGAGKGKIVNGNNNGVRGTVADEKCMDGKKGGKNARKDAVNGTNNGVRGTVADENCMDGKKGGKNARKDVAELENVVMEDEKAKRVEEKFFLCNYKFLWSSIDEPLKYNQSLGLSDATIKLMKDNLGLIGKANAKELDDEWKELLMEEVELCHKRAALVRKQIKLVFDRMNKHNVG